MEQLMPELAQLVTIDLAKKGMSVDGVRFPWYINEDGPIVNNLLTPGAMRSVTLTFFPKDVEVDLAKKTLLVDGREFPWLINEQGPTVNNLDAPDELTSVTLTFYTCDVEVIPENAQESAEKPEVPRDLDVVIF